MAGDDMKNSPGESTDGNLAPRAFRRRTHRPCPVCGLAVATGEIRCPRCHALLITSCSGACISCGSRTCLREDYGA
jgi:hypothetical protein